MKWLSGLNMPIFSVKTGESPFYLKCRINLHENRTKIFKYMYYLAFMLGLDCR